MKKRHFVTRFLWLVLLVGVALFLTYGLWPRMDERKISSQIGNKYKDFTDFTRDFGQPLWDRTTILNGTLVHGNVYVDRFIFPRKLIAIYTGQELKILGSANGPLKGQVFYFPQQSPFVVLNFLEFVLKEKFTSKSNAEMREVVKKLFPDR